MWQWLCLVDFNFLCLWLEESLFHFFTSAVLPILELKECSQPGGS